MQMFTPWRNWVYPRACGGTISRVVHGTRGDRPSQVGLITMVERVYPRACGGTAQFRHGVNPVCTGVYPRACGGTEGSFNRRPIRVPPHARG